MWKKIIQWNFLFHLPLYQNINFKYLIFFSFLKRSGTHGFIIFRNSLLTVCFFTLFLPHLCGGIRQTLSIKSHWLVWGFQTQSWVLFIEAYPNTEGSLWSWRKPHCWFSFACWKFGVLLRAFDTLPLWKITA